jgi:hypothetical protein
MATLTMFYECKGGPADGEVVELPRDATEAVLEHAVTVARDHYVVRLIRERRCLIWARQV